MLRRVLIFLGYLALATLLVGATFVLVAYGNDYTYDFATHRIIQEGHVIMDSLPNHLRVTADGKLLSKKTPYQAAYRVGLHTFALSEPGYWPWQKTLQVFAGDVTLAPDVILVPRQPITKVLDSRTSIIAQSISKDHRHLAYITGGPHSALYTMDLNNPKPVKLYTPAAATPTQPAEVLTSVTWSADASHLLLVSSIGGKAQHRLIAADGSGSIDLTTQYGFDFSGLQFSAYDWRQLYWISQGGLRKLDVGAQSVSDVLSANVTQFWPINNRTLYVQDVNSEESLWSIDSNGNRQQLIDALTPSPAYAVAYANYSGDDELAVIPEKSEVGTLYTGIFGSTPEAKTLAQGVTNVSFSPDSHFVTFSSTSHMVTYDLAESAAFNKMVLYSVDSQPGSLADMVWFDSYHLLTNRNGYLYWMEYDGGNGVLMGKLYDGFPAYHTSDYKSIIEFAPAKQGVNIVQLQIVS